MTTESTLPRDESSEDYLPRERLRRFGPSALNDIELLSLVLGTGRPGEHVSALSARILAECGGSRGLVRASTADLARTLGHARAARIAGAFELVRRALSVPLGARTPYVSSRDVVAAFAPRLGDLQDERVVVLVMDARQRVLVERVVAMGGPTSCHVSVREVFATAVREGGASLLLVHNHPSGDPMPSADDVRLTMTLAEAGRMLELPLLDHVIVARDGSFSFLDSGLLNPVSSTKQGVA